MGGGGVGTSARGSESLGEQGLPLEMLNQGLSELRLRMLIRIIHICTTHVSTQAPVHEGENGDALRHILP